MEKEVKVCPPPSCVDGYDKRRDRFEVSQTGFLNLNEAFLNHAVPADFAQDDVSYDDVDDPSKVIGKPKDAFELMHYNQSVHDYKPSSSNPSGE